MSEEGERGGGRGRGKEEEEEEEEVRKRRGRRKRKGRGGKVWTCLTLLQSLTCACVHNVRM